MDSEAGKTYQVGTKAMAVVLQTFIDWAVSMLSEAERDEAMFHITEIAKAYLRFTQAVTDFTTRESK